MLVTQTRAVLAGTLTLVVVAVMVGTVSAQAEVLELGTLDENTPATPSAAMTTSVAPDTVFTKTTDSARQKELETLYQALIEDYGVKARQFGLSRAQWQSVQTLRSLEESVLATNAVMTARTRTLITYFELLLEVLENTRGIELSLKQSRAAALTARIEWLRQHQEQLTQAVDRDGVNQKSDEFSAQAEVIVMEAEQALMLIRLGQIQSTFDRINGLYGRIVARNTANPGNATQEVERKRAYVQVEILRDEIQSELSTARASLDAKTAPRGRVQDSYPAFVGSLESPYVKISQYLLYLEELARDTW